MLRFATVLVIGLVLAGCRSMPREQDFASFDPKLLVQQPVSHLPLINAGNLQWRVRAIVNGTEGEFAVDTGSATTILSPEFAKKITLLHPPTSGRFVRLTYLQLSNIIYLDFYAPVLKLDHINRAMRTPIDGILGNNVLRKTACSIDWRNNTLTLDTADRPRPADAIPITVRDNRIFLTAKVNDQRTEFALDTGAYCSSLTSGEIRRLKIPDSKKTRVIEREVDIVESSRVTQTQVVLDNFDLDKIHATNFPMLSWNSTVLGMDLLDPWILNLDERAGWMSLTPH